MKNYTTQDFCRKFGACLPGARFARQYKTMRDCYAALLAGEAGDNSRDWAIWTATRPGVMSARDLRLFAVRCARQVQHLMKDQRPITALDVAERYANGEATDEELKAAQDAALAARAAADAAWAAADAAWAADENAAWAARDAAWGAARAAAGKAARAAWDAAIDEESKAQLKLLADLGNPFEGEEEK